MPKNIPNTTPRPVCVHCGKKYGQRRCKEIIDIVKEREAAPHLETNLILVSSQSWPYGTDTKRIVRTFWDGQSWYGGYKPFCTLNCALDYARRAYRGEKVVRQAC